jgi:diguanylate cyclase (GGDEF)-like protein
MDVPVFAVWLIDKTRSALHLAFEIPGEGTVASAVIELDDPHSGAARSVRELRQVIDTPADTMRNVGTRSMGTRLSAPFIVGARVIGALSIQSDRTDAYSENERSIMHALCTYAAIALENAATCHELESTVSALLTTQTELAARTAEYEHLSLTDALTGVPNRRHFTERAKIEIAEARRNGTELGVAMFDIDHFKKVNDTYGHFTGDRILQLIAEVAKEALRSGDLLARVGGEEFALLLPGAEPAKALAIAERLREAVENTAFCVEEFDLHVTASFGVANFGLAGDTFDDALRRADGALYRAKQDGRNRVRCAP